MEKGTKKSCKCEDCAGACLVKSGRFTPREASKAINAGLAKKMMAETDVLSLSKVYILTPATKGYGGKMAPLMSFISYFFGETYPCIFFKKGLCQIHDSGFKPVECRKLIHGNKEPFDVDALVKQWDTELGRKVLRKWRESVSTKKGNLI